jgi:hypothetical protein
MRQFPKGRIQPRKIIWMDLTPHLGQRLWLPFLPLPVNAPITYIVFEAARG